MLRRSLLQMAIVPLIFCWALIACQASMAKKALVLSDETLANRQLQTRTFPTNDEKLLLSAGAAVLQDLGFHLDIAESHLGVIVASRERGILDAEEFISLLVLWGPSSRKQKVFASLMTRPIDEKRIAVRITFQHRVWMHNDYFLIKDECINDSKIYEEFFTKLSKSVFLVAHEL